MLRELGRHHDMMLLELPLDNGRADALAQTLLLATADSVGWSGDT